MFKKTNITTSLIGLVSALFLSLGLSAAEPTAAPAENQQEPRDRFEMMAQKLELTEKQKKDLKPMLEKLKKNRADALKKLDEQEEKELATILKPEQVSQVSRYLKRSQRMGGGEGMKKAYSEKRKPGNDGQKGVYPKPPAKLPPKKE